MFLGRVQTESKIENENQNERKKGADWCLVHICSPSFFLLREIQRFPTYCQNKKVERCKTKSKSKARTATIQRILLVSAVTSGYHIRTAVHSAQPTASTATQPHRSLVNNQQANHNNSPNVLGPLFPGVRAEVKRIGDDFSMIPSRTRLEVRSQYNLKFDPGASTSDAPPPPPWEAQRPPGVEMSACMPAALVNLCCRTLDCRHVFIVLNGP